MLEWTGERYLPFASPELVGVEIHYEHLHRYAFACQFVSGKKVLDLASGEGYGSYLLSQEADHVVGVEIDPESVEHARTKYPRDDLEFMQGSILEIPIAGEHLFDLVVCFEAIEHVSDHDKLLSEVKRLLKADGLFIVSTPNKKIYTDEPNYHNPFHIKELYFSDFTDLLSNYFSDIYTFGQRVYAGSNIWRLSSKKVSDYSEFIIGKEDNGFEFKSGPEKSPLYFIAIASNSSLGERQNINSYFIDTSNTLITQREGLITALTGQLNEVTKLSQTLEKTATEREGLLQEASNRAYAMEQAVVDRGNQIAVLTSQLQEASNRAYAMEQAVTEHDKQIATLSDRIKQADAITISLEHELAEIRSSVVWQMTLRFHNGLIERALPHKTRRRAWYDLGLMGGRKFVNEGRLSFRRNRDQDISSRTTPKIEVYQEIDPGEAAAFESERVIEKTVSVVIPTKNAGPDFEFTLEKIKNQKGIKSVEIIVVDSGSEDETLKIAEKFNSKIYNLKPEEFNHGLTRNYGAEKANGDYILFIVQDAIPIGYKLVYKLVKQLESDNKIAAVTCRQVPRSDSDIFARYTMWQHYRMIGFNGDKIINATINGCKNLSGLEKRKMAGLDDVCTCIKKDIFDDFKFKKTNFAEDLNLGIRLIEGGYKLGFSYSAGVIHSHNRTAEYFMRRYYVDTKSLNEMFNEAPNVREKDVVYVLSSICSLYQSLVLSAKQLANCNFKESNIDTIFSILKKILANQKKDSEDDMKIGGPLDDIIYKLDIICAERQKRDSFLFPDYINMLNHLQNYLNSIYCIYDISEIMDALYKLFCVLCGSYLGNLYFYKIDDEKFRMIDKLLSRGV